MYQKCISENKILIDQWKILFFLHRNQYIATKYKKEHAQAVFDHLVSEKKTCEDRLYEEEQRYRTLVTMRQKTLADIKVSIIFGLS